MAKSQETWNKKELTQKKEKKRKDKEKKRLEKKASGKEGSSLEDMIAYVDENGMISDTPPDPTKKLVVKIEDIEVSVPRRAELTEQDLIRKGVVSFFNDSKGYGFIRDLDSQESIFVHMNGLLDSVKEGDKVTFEIAMGKKGPTAVSVKLV
ncbi:MAG: cold shock domain-containing protein [Bacteroidales bacterium]|nr:cold shock domain-containing protein [Bacteroidales bacterium]